ncbi:alpha/beta hydrolase [Rhodococcus aetherivorans]|uniref:alpha/beta hydrolase n=1 Tax=Rhodococcus aetherivorans TaxID=191292 RepID=UPI0003E27B36|nr:alpha/beta hydrolase family protein [Rhodococcus aetherivorans]ETT23564.1 esterase [Rhodococcus rhodochrous ATCC 21198]MDV6296674.1 alpha/beta hydrolase family protein [Rhodococcus aetherivorans]NGP28326.1 esterase family protein [Rhodococcus aetherivorans]
MSKRVGVGVARSLAVALTAATVPLAAGWSTAAADPVLDSGRVLASVAAPNGSKITKAEVYDEDSIIIWVYSASMDREIPVDVWRPADTSEPRPTLYLLNGAGGGEDGGTWRLQTDAISFLTAKNINVVSPLAGRFSYYTDWKNPDPVLGNNKWTTFISEELPPIMDAALGANGVNAIAGLSSSGTSVFSLATAKPGLFRGIAAYSGCAQTSDPIGQQFVRLTVETWGGGKTVNMWGPPDDPAWAANDPYLHAERLRGFELYVSNGNGLPGRYDNGDGPAMNGDAGNVANQVVVGGVIEAATNYCTQNLRDRLEELGIPATFNFRDSGTHSWGYWEDELKASWPVLARALQVEQG